MMVGRVRRRRDAGAISVLYCEVCPVLTVALYVCFYIALFLQSSMITAHGLTRAKGLTVVSSNISCDTATTVFDISTL
jgi:hypothetical protein